MRRLGSIIPLGLIVISVVFAGCAQPPSGQGSSARRAAVADSPGMARGGTARVTIASFRELDFLPYSAVPGTYELRNAVNPGLVVFDDRGALRPLLVEAVPSLSNGLWKVMPDGRMETTWKIKDGALWHDGTPLTADDLDFTIRVGRDRSTAIFGVPAYSSIEEVTVNDPRTITVTWRQPFIDADQLFTIWAAWPIPKKVLEQAYHDEPGTLSQQPFWTVDFVGSGPYRLREYSAGLRIKLEAFDRYVLGRPKIDEIDVAYTPDPSTVLANILAGSVDMTIGIGLPVDSVVEIRDRWPDGKFTFEFSDQRWFRLDPQFIDPIPAAITDLRFRRAMLHAIDRQEMADSLQAGIAPVATTFMAPQQPEYASIEGRVMRYDYDPSKAAALLAELGYRAGGDGTLRDAAGRPLEVEIAGSNDAVSKPMLTVANYWNGRRDDQHLRGPATTSAGLAVAIDVHGFALFTGTHDLAGLPALRSSQARTAENNYEISGLPNWPRYRSPVLDDLVANFFRTIPKQERLELLTQINQHIFENLTTMGLYYFPTPYAVANRVTNVPVNRAARASLTWSIQEWDIRS